LPTNSCVRRGAGRILEMDSLDAELARQWRGITPQSPSNHLPTLNLVIPKRRTRDGRDGRDGLLLDFVAGHCCQRAQLGKREAVETARRRVFFFQKEKKCRHCRPSPR
jgi:hypothetical protein